MNPRTTQILTAALFLFLTGCGDAPAPQAEHLLLITIDTLRTDRLGCYGGPNRPSPNIDGLAERGTLFRDFYAQRAVTLPSMVSFFTSKYPYEHGIVNNKKKVQNGEWLLAERLQSAGFHTRAFNASAVLAPKRWNIEQGFNPNAYTFMPDERLMTARAERFIRERFGGKGRQFLWVHYMNPHKPYAPPAPYDRKFSPDYQGDYDGMPGTLDRIYTRKIDLAEEDRKHIEALYDGAIAFVDEQIGKLLTALEESGHAANTLVVFSADHGEDLGSHNYYYYHANSIYRSSTHIPLIFAQPDVVPAGKQVDGIVETIDFMPTVMNWLAVAPGKGPGGDTRMRGVDIGPVISGDETISKSFAFALVDQPVDQATEYIFSARNREWMYVWNKSGVHPSNPPLDGEYPIDGQELYHVSADPQEQKNVLTDHPDIADNLYRAVRTWLEQMVETRLEDNLTAEDREILKELGYLSEDLEERPKDESENESGEPK